jgi:hypothetical protein
VRYVRPDFAGGRGGQSIRFVLHTSPHTSDDDSVLPPLIYAIAVTRALGEVGGLVQSAGTGPRSYRTCRSGHRPERRRGLWPRSHPLCQDPMQPRNLARGDALRLIWCQRLPKIHRDIGCEYLRQ